MVLSVPTFDSFPEEALCLIFLFFNLQRSIGFIALGALNAPK
jgi:hypothetical protein|tara:strand:- start:388 stop:513 length:126 start_codon:yes stop_codon:yes gene_type:complete